MLSLNTKIHVRLLTCLVGTLLSLPLRGESYPDQFFTLKGADSLITYAEAINNLIASQDRRSLQLAENQTTGYIIFKPQTVPFPFNYGLPSWNGSSPENNAYFKVFVRFPYAGAWSPWLTVGYWDKEWGSSYGTRTWDDGTIDIDEIKLFSYYTTFQMSVYLYRANTTVESPTLRRISLMLSDTRTTAELDYNAIVNDKPPYIFIPTTFYYQYGLDPEIGGSICSPTSVSMILRSFGIEVDPLQFAIATKDPYWGIYGVWPRNVQHAAEYGLDGAVKQYRTWSQAYEVLAQGGRIAMSVGKPLYTGHLMMLAGFTSDGRPIVHDPAKSAGYGYIFDKSDLSHSWFDKGGVGYTFFLDSTKLNIEHKRLENPALAQEFVTIRNYPNPFNLSTTLLINIGQSGNYKIQVIDVNGHCVADYGQHNYQPGILSFQFSGIGLASGVYFVTVSNPHGQHWAARLLLLK